MAVTRWLALCFLTLILAACSSGPPVRVFPPQASVQELRVQPDGVYVATIRVQNFSTVPMTFSRLAATLTLADREATRLDVDPSLTVGPGSNELFRHEFTPTAEMKRAIDAAFSGNRSVRYRLEGRLASSDPGSDDAFDYSSALDPVPGLPGVLR